MSDKERELILLRAGLYAGMAATLLGDRSYMERSIGRAHEIPSEQFEAESREIHDRLVARVRDLARDVLGDEQAREWLERPVPALDDQAPSVLLSTPEGIRRVLDLIARVEHGVW